MSGVPPANLVTGIVQTTVSQRERTEEKNIDERQRAQQAKEQDKLSDQQEHQVEDTFHTDPTRVRPHDEEEANRRRRNRHRLLPEDGQQDDAQILPDDDTSSHIDLHA